jgi:glycoside hydrolase-like protein
MSVEVFGIDYAWSKPAVDDLLAAKVKFVCRYLSHDTTGKNLSPQEAKKLINAGISIVVVWESSKNRALKGYGAGVSDAKDARTQALSCGLPDDRPIYFAVDFDAPEGQQVLIDSYLRGVASVIGLRRTGLYAGYYVIKRAFNHNVIKWGWQTSAWSGGNWDSRAHIRQYENDKKLGGVGVDYNKAVKYDYGQWPISNAEKSSLEDILPTAKEIGDAVAESFKREVYNERGHTFGDVAQALKDGMEKLITSMEEMNKKFDELNERLNNL